MVKRGLGKGFDALIPDDVLDSEFDATADLDEKVSDLRVLNVADIAPDPEQPRRNFDEAGLRELADSIREFGVLQPIVVTPRKTVASHSAASDISRETAAQNSAQSGDEKTSRNSEQNNSEAISRKSAQFEIVAGERRWRAAKMAGLAKIPAIVRTLSAQHKLELSIIENVQRADLNPLETATAYLKLKNQFNLTDADIAARVGKAASTVSNQLRLLNLPEFAKKSLTDGAISEGHARQILALPDDAAREKLFNEISRNNWSVRKAEQFVIGYKKSGAAASGAKSRENSAKNATVTETELTRAIAAEIGLPEKSVAQKTTGHGGEIVIKFANEAELAKIREIFAKE